MNIPLKLCAASSNRLKRSCPSNKVAADIIVGEVSGVVVGLRVGDDSIVGTRVAVDEIGVDTTCGAQAVITSNATTINRWDKRLGNILIYFLLS
jgi:hypothetical protein